MEVPTSYYPSDDYVYNAIEFSDTYTYQPSDASAAQLYQSNPYSPESLSKKRKIERACDACRRRKIRCDGPRMSNNICTHCSQNRKICSYVSVPFSPTLVSLSPDIWYITGLEDRLEKMEALLKRCFRTHYLICPTLRRLYRYEEGANEIACQLRPEEDFSEELGPPVVRDSWKSDPAPVRRPSPHEQSTSPPAIPSTLKDSPSAPLRPGPAPSVSHTVLSSSTANIHSRRSGGTPRTDTDLSSDGGSSDSEEVGELSLSRGMKRLTIRGLEPAQENSYLADSQVRFHGKSSWFKLIEPTRKLRDEHVYRVTGGAESSVFPPDNNNPVNAAATRRPQFWTTPHWELAYEGSLRLQNLCHIQAQHFPPPDLADELIRLFFAHINPQFPLFHQPTFEQQYKGGLPAKDPWFGCLCLALFAVASRWCDDPRVLDDNKHDIPHEERTDDERKWQRAGWKYFNVALDVHRESRSLFHPPGLFEVQTMTLMGMFVRGTAFHPVAWLFISVGIRKAQDVGAHRKKVYGDKPSVEGELWKRAFWILVLYDRIGSAALGRPCCSGEEDFDADLPLEVDDEYWETKDPEKAFQQPPGKPAKIAAFNSYLKLTEIAAYALRNLYALDRSKLLISVTRPRLHDVLTQLNKALLQWIDSVPPHLHWSPCMEDPLFANQAATLYITYYLVQIIIYRPFLPPSLRSGSNITPHAKMPIPCIAICVNAARCCSRILQTQVSRGISNIYSLICAAHMCAAILLMNYWDLKWQERNLSKTSVGEDLKSPLAVQMADVLQEVKVFIQALELVRPRWRNAEIYLQVLHTLFIQLDEQAFCQIPPSAFGAPQYLDPLPEYPPFPSAITGNAYTPKLKPAEPTHFFDIPHITRCPLPTNLYFFDQPFEEGELSWSMGNPVQAQRLPQTSEGPQPIVYRRIAQRSYDDFQGTIPPNAPKLPTSNTSSESSRVVYSPNSAHLDNITSQHAIPPLPPRDVYIPPGSMHYDSIPSIPTQKNDLEDTDYASSNTLVMPPVYNSPALEWARNSYYSYLASGGCGRSLAPSDGFWPQHSHTGALRREEIGYSSPHGEVVSHAGHY
ncbi:hypothetical protein ID866_5411 [Astraeus odoratus]|nr:hypothetical protein ID866_5411 [Astraeus odoratus]